MTKQTKRTAFAQVLIRLRSEKLTPEGKPWSQQALARAIGVTPGLIGQVEAQADRWLGDDNIDALVKVMGLTAAEEAELREAKASDVRVPAGTIGTAWQRIEDLERRVTALEAGNVTALPSGRKQGAEVARAASSGGDPGTPGGELRARPGPEVGRDE